MCVLCVDASHAGKMQMILAFVLPVLLFEIDFTVLCVPVLVYEWAWGMHRDIFWKFKFNFLIVGVVWSWIISWRSETNKKRAGLGINVWARVKKKSLLGLFCTKTYNYIRQVVQMIFFLNCLFEYWLVEWAIIHSFCLHLKKMIKYCKWLNCFLLFNELTIEEDLRRIMEYTV